MFIFYKTFSYCEDLFAAFAVAFVLILCFSCTKILHKVKIRQKQPQALLNDPLNSLIFNKYCAKRYQISRLKFIYHCVKFFDLVKLAVQFFSILKIKI